jgi:hypothetical protein
MAVTIQEIREGFKPERILLLLVGESPPASGDFFYRGRTQMVRYTATAYEQAHRIQFEDLDAFRAYFKASGAYLDDLVDIPVNKMSAKERRAILANSVEGFAARLQEYQPATVISLLRRIDLYVEKAIQLSGISCAYHCVSFPGNSHQAKFIEQMQSIL